MSSITGLLGNAGVKSIPAVWKEKMLAAILGCTVVFAMGFTETPAVHNAAHDGRHAAGFPCH